MRLLQGHAQQFGPVTLPGRIGDVILADFDFGIIQRATESVTGNAVVRLVHVVRLVVSRPQPRFTRECVKQPPGESLVSSRVKDTDIPRALHFLEDGRETVQGYEHRRRSRTPARPDFRCDARVIGLVDLFLAKPALNPVQPLVARHPSAMRNGRDSLGRRRRAIAVNDESRIGLGKKNSIEPLRHCGAQFGHAGIDRDMAGQVFLFEAERSEPGGDGASGMVPRQNEGRTTPRIQAYDGFGITRSQQGRLVCSPRQNMTQTCRF